MNTDPAGRANGPTGSPGPKGETPWWRRLIGWPATPLGWTATGLAVLSLGFLWSVFWWGDWGAKHGRDRSTFFSDPTMAFTLIGTAATAISGGLAAAISLFRRERSLLLLPVLVWGALVLIFTLGELGGLGGHGHP
jgi:hypothetical protein